MGSLKKFSAFLGAFLLSFLFIVPSNSVYAYGSIKVNNQSNTVNMTIEAGKSKSFTVSVESAAGRIDVSSGNSAVATVDKTSMFLDSEGKVSEKVTVTGVAVGETAYSVTATDVTAYDYTRVTGSTILVVVKVTNPAPTPTPTPTPEPTPEPTPKSDNTNIKSVKIGDNNIKLEDGKYKTTVDSDIDEIEIKIEAEDSNAKVSGAIGKQKVKEGLNKYVITVVAENGTRKDYIIEVTRAEATCPVCETCQKCEEKECSPLFMIIAAVEGAIILLGLIVLLCKKLGKKKDNGDNGGVSGGSGDGEKEELETTGTTVSPAEKKDDTVTIDELREAFRQ